MLVHTGASGTTGFEEATFHRSISVAMPQIFGCWALLGASWWLWFKPKHTREECLLELEVLLHFNKGVTTLRVTDLLDRPRSQSEVNVHTMR